MMNPLGPGYIGHHAAFAVLAKGRELFTWLVDQEIAPANPFLRFGLGKPPPRQVFWEDPHFTAISASADKLKLPSIALAIDIAAYIGQREADILKLASSRWQAIPAEKFRFNMEIYQQLKSDKGPNAGEVMGIYVRQGKTKRWIGVPIEGDMRRRIEASIEQNGKRKVATTGLIICERTGLPWEQDHFIHKFAEITGHKLGTIKTILETYMPRTEAMAGRAVVARLPVREANSERKEG